MQINKPTEDFIELIKNFMYKCPLCNTGVQFDVPELTSVSKVVELSEAINKLICPKCGKPLGEDAKKAFDTVKAYNEAAYNFVHIHKNVEMYRLPIHQE